MLGIWTHTEVMPELNRKSLNQRSSRKNRKSPRKVFLNNPHPDQPLLKNRSTTPFRPQGQVLKPAHQLDPLLASKPCQPPIPAWPWGPCQPNNLFLLICSLLSHSPCKMTYFRICLMETCSSQGLIALLSVPSTKAKALITQTRIYPLGLWTRATWGGKLYP